MLRIDEFYVGQRVLTHTADEFSDFVGVIIKIEGNEIHVAGQFPYGHTDCEFDESELEPQ